MVKNKFVIYGLISALVVVAGLWLFTRFPIAHRSVELSTVSAGLVVAGKLGDRSYNDLTYRGFEQAAQELSLKTTVVEPAEPAEVRLILSRMARDGLNLIVGIGFTARQPIADLAPQHMNTHFLLVDDVIDAPPPNVRSVQFREQEAGFLAGIVAGLVTQTGKVGVVAGMDLPVVRRYVNGYKEGVKHVNPSATVLVNFAGSFSDPAKGKELSLGLYSAGADVILNGAGQTGNGIFDAAKSSQRYAIGVDLDQSHQAPDNVLTSAIKKVDVAIYTAVKDAVSGHFLSGIVSLGVSDGVIDLAPLNAKLVPIPVRQQIETVVAAMKRGEIKVVANYDAP